MKATEYQIYHDGYDTTEPYPKPGIAISWSELWRIVAIWLAIAVTTCGLIGAVAWVLWGI